MTRELDVDDALYEVGGWKRWHILVFLMVCTSAFSPLTWLELSIVFIGYAPPHHCQVPEGLTKAEAIPVMEKSGEETYSTCDMYMNLTVNNETTGCVNGWAYDLESSREVYIATEWDLVCDRNYLAELSQTIYQIGCLFGQIIGSHLSDRLGRKKVHTAGCVGIGVVGILTAFSRQYMTFAILRGILGFMITFNVYAGFVLMLELFDSKRRVYIGIGFNLWWVVLYEILPFMAYFVRNWRVLHAVFGVYCFVWIAYIWIIPESPFWLTANGKYKQAECDLVGMAAMNGVEVEEFQLKRHTKHLQQARNGGISSPEASTLLPPSDDAKRRPKDSRIPPDAKLEFKNGEVEAEKSKDQDGSDYMLKTELKVWDIFKDSKLRKHAAVASMFWLACNMVYYGLILSTPVLAGNRYVNYMIGGLVEIPAYSLAIFCAKRIGRRLTSFGLHMFTAIPLGITLFIPDVTESGVSLSWLRVVTAMLAKFGISATFAVIILYTTELFPTNLRSSSMGLCNLLGRVGGMIAPMCAYAAKQLYWLPNVVFSIIVIIAGLLILMLPETGNRPLPATLRDIHNLYSPLSRQESTQQGTEMDEIATLSRQEQKQSAERSNTTSFA